MRSLFSNASFARFDLGRHVLGAVECPPGEMPMNNNGRITCVRYSPPSGMFMPAGPSKSIAYGMAQAGMPEPYLTQAERDNLLLALQSATSKLAPLQKLIDWSVGNDPELSRFLENDKLRFFDLADDIAMIQQDVDAIQSRLADTSAESWWRPSEQEYATIRRYTGTLDEMWRMSQAHKAIYVPLPGTIPPPSLTAAGAEAAGASDKNILVGGIVLIGLGLLISALA